MPTMAEFEDFGMPCASTLKEAQSDEVGQHTDHSAETRIPRGPPPTHDDEEAMRRWWKSPHLHPSRRNGRRSQRLRGRRPLTARSRRISKPREPTGLDLSLEELVASSEGAGNRAEHSAQPQDLSRVLPKATQPGGPTLAEALVHINHPRRTMAQKLKVTAPPAPAHGKAEPPVFSAEGIPGPGPKPDHIPKASAMIQAEASRPLIVWEPPPPPPKPTPEYFLAQHNFDMATDSPDMSNLLLVCAEWMMKVLLGNVTACILAQRAISDISKHTTWYHLRRISAPEGPRAGLAHHCVERGIVGGTQVQDVQVLARWSTDELVMHSMCAHMQACSVRVAVMNVSCSACYMGVEGVLWSRRERHAYIERRDHGPARRQARSLISIWRQSRS